MPNYCENGLTVSNDNPKVIERIVKAFQEGGLFNEFIPSPNESLVPDTYDWCCENWGTKWDVGHDRYNRLDIISPTEIKFCLFTAWSPPLPVLDHWVDLGCNVVGTFLEIGFGYSGIYKNKVLWELRERRETPPDIGPIVESLFV